MKRSKRAAVPPAAPGPLRIRAVAELTGVPAATLRAWERRYGVPVPPRSGAAYRLYGQVDVRAVRRMRELVDDGIAPAEAARLVLAEAAPDPAPPPDGADRFDAAAEALVRATADFAPPALEESVRRAIALGAPAVVFDRVFRPALVRIGELWHAGTVTVAQEHLASTAITSATLELLRLAQPADPPRRALVASFADDEHVLPAIGVALRLAAWGFGVWLLGARTPPSAIGSAVRALRPDLVALSATLPPIAARARELVEAYADACGRTPLVVGGSAVGSIATWVERAGGAVATHDWTATRAAVDELLRGRRRVP